jgi:hypothetical protein
MKPSRPCNEGHGPTTSSSLPRDCQWSKEKPQLDQSTVSPNRILRAIDQQPIKFTTRSLSRMLWATTTGKRQQLCFEKPIIGTYGISLGQRTYGRRRVPGHLSRIISKIKMHKTALKKQTLSFASTFFASLFRLPWKLVEWTFRTSQHAVNRWLIVASTSKG